MKNFVRSWSLLVAFLGPLTLAAPAVATVAWTATFEKNKSGDVCSSTAADAEFKPGINETKGTRINAQVLGEAVYSGSFACKVTVHPDDTFTFGQNRVDIQHPSTLTDEGKDSYLSGHYMMPADAKVRNEIGFYETKTSSSNAMDIWVEPKVGGGTTINFAIGFLPAKASWTADFKTGVWHQVAIHVHWAQSATAGYVDFWLDGVKTITMLKGKTKPDGNPLYYQTGLHRKDTSNNTDVLYFDDFIEGDAEADIKIAAPGSGAPDGGAPTDASGAAGTGGAAGNGTASGAAGTSGTAGAGAAGASGTAGTSGAAGNTGTAGTSATGTAGTGATGTAGTSATGTAGMGATGASGTSGSHATHSGGCATAGAGSEPEALALSALALAIFGAAFASRRRRC